MTPHSIPGIGVPQHDPVVAWSGRDRNRLLRRADWRYLLPDPSPYRALCMCGPELRASCGIVATVVDESPEPGVSYDLVVAEDPDGATLQLLARAARADGACYVEWRAVGPGGARRLERRLERAGFGHPRCYQPWPSVTRPRAWVPIDDAVARYYWRGAVHSSEVLRDRLGDAAVHGFARLGMRTRVCVVALGSAAPPANIADPFLLRLAREHGALLPFAPEDRDSGGRAQRLLLLTLGARPVGKIVALAFDAAPGPAAAIKTARVIESVAGLTREAELLDTVHAQHSGGMAGVPHVLFRAEMRGAPVIGESPLAGTSLVALLKRRHYPALAGRVTAWLSELAEPAGRAAWEPVWNRIVAPVLERFESEFGPVLDAARLQRTRDVLRTLGPLPVVCEQRDFSPWNVFDRADGIVVLDWESGEPRGLPAMDLVYFFTHAAYYLEGAWTSGDFEAAYRAAWSTETAIGRVNNECVRRYLERLGVSTQVVAALRLFAWMLHAHSDYVHMSADTGGSPGADMLRRSIFLRLYNAELRGDASC